MLLEVGKVVSREIFTSITYLHLPSSQTKKSTARKLQKKLNPFSKIFEFILTWISRYSGKSYKRSSSADSQHWPNSEPNDLSSFTD
jgi:hypothetical protein